MLFRSAKDSGMPEGLAKMLDILSTASAPAQIEAVNNERIPDRKAGGTTPGSGTSGGSTSGSGTTGSSTSGGSSGGHSGKN